jgi:hypothetical protein
MNQIRRRLGQRFVRFAGAGVFRVFLFQRFDLFLRQKREELQVANRIAVVRIAQQYPRMAERWQAGLFKAIESLKSFPERCSLAPESELRGRARMPSAFLLGLEGSAAARDPRAPYSCSGSDPS